MGYTVEFGKTPIRFKFNCHSSKQKILVDALLRYGNLDLTGLATVLGLPSSALRSILNGTSFLRGKQADNLVRMFLVFFGG